MMRIMQVKNTVVPIVGESSNGQPYPVGSGVLLEFGNARWLVSAAHVLDEADHNTIYIPGKSGPIPLEGDFMKSKAPDAGRYDDLIDLGFLNMDKIGASISNDYKFLPEWMISVDHATESGRNYLFLGFPHKAVKVRKDQRKIRSQPHSYEAKGVELERYSSMGLDPKIHIAISFDAKRAKNKNGQIEVPKDQHGTSGGGVWIGEPRSEVDQVLIPMLVGIIIEHRASEKVLLATKIVPLLKHMKCK